MEVFAVILLVLGLAALVVWSRHLREAKQMLIRKIMHDERMVAMEKGISFKDLDHDGMARELAHLNEGSRMPAADMTRNLMWIRYAALCFGLLFLFGGAGVAVGFSMVSDLEIRGTWPMGLIPALIGIGLLLFHGLCRGYEKKLG